MQIMRLITAFNCCLSPAIQDQLRTKIKSRVAECNCTLQAKQSSEIAMFQLLNHTKKMNSIKLTFGVKKQIAIAKPRKKQGFEALGGSQARTVVIDVIQTVLGCQLQQDGLLTPGRG